MSPTTTSGELRVDGLYVERGIRTVVHNASLTVPTGRVTALLGPNGAGKSSLVLGVGGVLRPRAGTVTLGGQDLTAKPPGPDRIPSFSDRRRRRGKPAS